MKINLRKKKLENNYSSLFLEYYLGYSKNKQGKIKHKRKYEFLDIKVYTEPKNKEQREHNKELFKLAESIIHKKEIECIGKEYDFKGLTQKKISLFDFINNEISGLEIKKTTKAFYKSVATLLFDYCNPDITFLNDVNQSFILGFKEFLNNHTNSIGLTLKPNSKNAYYSRFKTWIISAHSQGYINENPFTNIKNFKPEKTEKIYLTFDEIQKLDKTECKIELFKRAFLFSCFAGLRISDLKNLEWNQIIKGNAGYKIHFKQQKTNNREYLPLNNQALKYLGDIKNTNEKVFKGLTGNNLAIKILNQWGKNAGIEKYISFHTARHTFATLLISSGVDLYSVSKFLGHKSYKTTEIYAKITNTKLYNEINKIPEFKIN